MRATKLCMHKFVACGEMNEHLTEKEVNYPVLFLPKWALRMLGFGPTIFYMNWPLSRFNCTHLH